MTIAYDIVTAAATAMMAGNEFAIAAFVHPQLGRLSSRTHAEAAAPMAAGLGKAMPFWYGIALLLLIGAAFEHRPISHGSGRLIAYAASLWAATIIFTVTLLVPINRRIAKMNAASPYDGWLDDRVRWDLLYSIRLQC
ncbi:DUF1772 domain-containing protein [Tunturibacter empetritectus]|uniref:DUF1772 domain-containing protein n=1 Tax=Tunturiibacter empetritectus TaxID=3069691 RepID=A0A7W8IJ98_9BACT|nr:DUF1772 domain-containing protein [Edaphobacter lichenicola]MBB5317451.1 hypothetical protein [Edaphobacter lichenicola]